MKLSMDSSKRGKFLCAAMLALTLLTGESAVAEDAKSAKEDPIVGRWRWMNAQIKTFHANGTAEGDGFKGTWKCVSTPTPPTYQINWSDHFVDKLRLIKNGSELKGTNNDGRAISAVRLPWK